MARCASTRLCPRIEKSTGFPKIPGVTYTGLFNSLRATDYNVQPPAEGAEYGVLVPRCDQDGNSLAGIRLPPLQVPVATYTAWNLRAAGHAEGECCSTSGSYIPFAKTKAERLASGDPRLSIEERYRSHSRLRAASSKGCAQAGEGRLSAPGGCRPLYQASQQRGYQEAVSELTGRDAKDHSRNRAGEAEQAAESNARSSERQFAQMFLQCRARDPKLLLSLALWLQPGAGNCRAVSAVLAAFIARTTKPLNR